MQHRSTARFLVITILLEHLSGEIKLLTKIDDDTDIKQVMDGSKYTTEPES
jgi:hypothetical protein